MKSTRFLFFGIATLIFAITFVIKDCALFALISAFISGFNIAIFIADNTLAVALNECEKRLSVSTKRKEEEEK
jgi:hypothetical membrane protein